MSRIPQFKPLAIIEQDELAKLRQRKLELEAQLKEKEKDKGKGKKQQPIQEQENNELQIHTIDRRKEKRREKQYIERPQLQQNEQGNSQAQMAQMREQERLENEMKQLKATITHLEKEKKVMQNQFEQMKESIRHENMQLKEQSMKNKVESSTLQRQKDDLENEKTSLIKDNRKLRSDYRILQERLAEMGKQCADFEARAKSNKDVVLEREDRVKWAENQLITEQHGHKQTQQQCMLLQNEIENLKREIEFLQDDRKRLSKEIEEIMFGHKKKYEELHEGRLRDQRDINDGRIHHEEMRRQLNQQGERIRILELERERLMVRVQDYEKMEHKLGARDREIMELEIELDRIKRAKGTHIIEKIVHPVAYEVPSRREEVIQLPVEDREIIKLREDLLYLQQDRDRALDEAEYWRQRYQDLELQQDRTINLLAHQNADEYENNNRLNEHKKQLFTKVMGLINDINKEKRESKNEQVINTLTKILQNNNDLLKFLN